MCCSVVGYCLFFFKQKTAYEMRISDWSSDVCSSDLKYQEQKRQQEARAKQKIIQVKEVKFRPGTDEGDYQVKLRNLRRFIEEGDKAKVTLRFQIGRASCRERVCQSV